MVEGLRHGPRTSRHFVTVPYAGVPGYFFFATRQARSVGTGRSQAHESGQLLWAQAEARPREAREGSWHAV
eukprot:scaffold13136_cov63-Phaeocystis_antarctica.AAC.5